MGHFIHAFKKNVSILYIVMNNETYGLTKGQPSQEAADRRSSDFDPERGQLSPQLRDRPIRLR